MRIHRIERAQEVRRSIDEVFAFFSHARNLEAITPPWLRFELLTPDPPVMRAGTLIGYRLRLHGVPVTSRIEQWEPGARFVDRRVRGPYRLWRDRHEFASHCEGTLVRDRVDDTLPPRTVGRAGRRAVHPPRSRAHLRLSPRRRRTAVRVTTAPRFRESADASPIAEEVPTARIGPRATRGRARRCPPTSC